MNNTKKTKKRESWIKKRHLFITNLAKIVVMPFAKWKYGIDIEKFEDQGDRQYLILSNHQTGFDQFFIAGAFKGAIYYVASEDIFSMGFVSDLLRWAVNPIPIKKQTTDVSAVLNCLRVAKEGGNIAIFPEGNRTYSGHTEHINPAIAMLAKKMGLPIAIMHIEGGYGVAPRWSNKVRKGNMRAYVVRVIEPEEYKELDDGAFTQLLESELYINEACFDGEYHSKTSAEYLERAIYYCPRCNSLSSFISDGNRMGCTKCDLNITYSHTKELSSSGGEFPYLYVADWVDAQNAFVNSLDLRELCDSPIYVEEGKLFEVIVYKNKKPLLEGANISLFGNRLTIANENDEINFDFDDIRAITVCGKNKLNFYTQEKSYQFVGNERFNALKYVNLVFRYKNIKKVEKGGAYDEFLGL